MAPPRDPSTMLEPAALAVSPGPSEVSVAAVRVLRTRAAGTGGRTAHDEGGGALRRRLEGQAGSLSAGARRRTRCRPPRQGYFPVVTMPLGPIAPVWTVGLAMSVSAPVAWSIVYWAMVELAKPVSPLVT